MNPRTAPKTAYFSDRQRLILDLLIKHDFVLVNGAYIGDVLSLQTQGLVVSKPIGKGKLEVRRKVQP